MIRVGFIGAVSKEWMGGLNYFKNLLFAISTLENKEIEPIVFVGRKTDEDIKAMFRKHAQVIEHAMFDRKSLSWFCWKVSQKLLKTNFLLDQLLKQHQINVVSHADVIHLGSCKTINWIPDFQHLHLPKMFSDAEIKHRNTHFLKLMQHSDAIVLSSFDALKDFNGFAPEYLEKAKVLQFVSQPDPRYFELNAEDEEKLRIKYNILTPFFYLPNQFWKHKNHMVVFEAVNILKEKGINITIVCTGHLHDYRNSEHIDTLTRFVITHHLEDQIKLLGLVDYADVFALIKYSEAVINPSLFEGWSSTVEECKSVGKNMILSDLNVHQEQCPEALFFQRNNAQDLANTLKKYIFNKKSIEKLFDLQDQTRLFALRYQSIVKKVIS